MTDHVVEGLGRLCDHFRTSRKEGRGLADGSLPKSSLPVTPSSPSVPVAALVRLAVPSPSTAASATPPLTYQAAR